MASSSKPSKAPGALEEQVKQIIRRSSASSSTTDIGKKILEEIKELQISSRSALERNLSAEILREMGTLLNIPSASKSKKSILAQQIFKILHKKSTEPKVIPNIPEVITHQDLEKLPMDVSQNIKGRVSAELKEKVTQPFMYAFEYLLTRREGSVRNTMREKLLNQEKYNPEHFEVRFHTVISTGSRYVPSDIDEKVTFNKSTINEMISQVNEYYKTIEKRTEQLKKRHYTITEEEAWLSYISIYNDIYSVTKDIGYDRFDRRKPILIKSKKFNSYIAINLLTFNEHNSPDYRIQSVIFRIEPDYKEGQFEELFVGIYWLRKYWKDKEFKGLYIGDRYIDMKGNTEPVYNYQYPFIKFDKKLFVKRGKYSYGIIGSHPAWTDKKAIHFMELFYKIFI
ncbi:MAG: hypothetical protein ACO27D_02635 [Candidatus Fonsibacter ubiquis]